MKFYIYTFCAFVMFVSISGLLGGCGGVIIRPAPADQTLSEKQVGGDTGYFVGNKILILDIDGPISNSRNDTGLFGGDNPTSLFCEKLDRAQNDKSIAAVILRINTPGGSVGAVDIMYRRLMRFRKSRPYTPVIAMIEDIGASGGYYMACGCDEIIALPSSITGSIGVVMQTFSVSGTMNLLGIQSRAITSGPFKDIASPFKPASEADQSILQQIVDEFYGNFVDVVNSGRKNLDITTVRKLADGRVYTGTQALKNGLIDSLGDMSDAEKLTKKLANISKAKLIMYHRPTGWRGSVESANDNTKPQMTGSINISAELITDLARPHFMYIWR